MSTNPKSLYHGYRHSQSIEIKFTTRPASVTVSLKANEKTDVNST